MSGNKAQENGLTIEDNRRRLPIKLNGETIITAVYNPSDPMAYRQMLKVQAMANGIEIPNGYEWTEEEQQAVEKRLRTGEDLDTANAAIQRRNTVIQGTMQMIDELYQAVDVIFGEGVCDILLKYSDEENNYFKKLIDIAFKEMNKARQVYKNQYKPKTQSDVME